MKPAQPSRSTGPVSDDRRPIGAGTRLGVGHGGSVEPTRPETHDSTRQPSPPCDTVSPDTAAPPTSGPVLYRLARFVAEDRLDTDPETLERLRDGVIDTFGCILAGSRHEASQRARRAVNAMSGPGCAPVYGTCETASRPAAAFLNAVAGHVDDFDDWEAPGNTHPSTVLLPALLATADDTASGAELARGYLAGFEVIARLGEALNFEHYNRGWHTTATLGAVGAAAAVARLLSLDAVATTHALSFAISRAAGYTCQFGSHAKPMQAGFAAETGVIAAHLAAAGLTSQPHVLDHARGWVALTAGVEPARVEVALRRLGTKLALAEHGLILKPWPSCGYTHRVMTCALELAPRIPDPDLIARIDLHLPDFHAAVLPFRQPVSRPEALFSLPFVAAMGLLARGLDLADLERRRWRDRAVRRLIALSRIHPFSPRRPERNYDLDDPDRVEVTLKSGEKLRATCAWPIGAPRNPMTADMVMGKFRDNAGPAIGARAADLLDWLAAHPVLPLFRSIGATS